MNIGSSLSSKIDFKKIFNGLSEKEDKPLKKQPQLIIKVPSKKIEIEVFSDLFENLCLSKGAFFDKKKMRVYFEDLCKHPYIEEAMVESRLTVFGKQDRIPTSAEIFSIAKEMLRKEISRKEAEFYAKHFE